MNKIRVLHVLGAMNRGGAETWLLHVLRHVDREWLQMDFLVHTDQPAAYDQELVALGARIFRCPVWRNPLLYSKRFLEIAKRCGPFDVLHSHVHWFSGCTLAFARRAGILMRVAHSHNDTRTLNSSKRLLRKAYQETSRHLIAANCTHGLAASEPAAEDLFGTDWRHNPRFRVLYCGIDLAAFQQDVDSRAVRAEFGFSERDLVFGHVGRFDPQKNHSFLIETARELVNMTPHGKFLMVGDGPLRPEMERRINALGLKDRIVFAGLRPDVPRLMTGAMDMLLFPSIHEGLPLVLMEAQAAGLYSIVSEGIPKEAIINPVLVHRLPLSAGAHEWARVACHIANQPRFDRRRAVKIVAASPFAIRQSIQHLCGIYSRAR
jgi:glycosyltransferase involved in cell wall biosynthesis